MKLAKSATGRYSGAAGGLILLTNTMRMYWTPVNKAENKGSGESSLDIRTTEIINITASAVELNTRAIDWTSHSTANLPAYPFCNKKLEFTGSRRVNCKASS